jgi:hypothetical protein
LGIDRFECYPASETRINRLAFEGEDIEDALVDPTKRLLANKSL